MSRVWAWTPRAIAAWPRSRVVSSSPLSLRTWTHPDERAQGAAQLVGQGGHELVLDAVGLASPPPHFLLEAEDLLALPLGTVDLGPVLDGHHDALVRAFVTEPPGIDQQAPLAQRRRLELDLEAGQRGTRRRAPPGGRVGARGYSIRPARAHAGRARCNPPGPAGNGGGRRHWSARPRGPVFRKSNGSLYGVGDRVGRSRGTARLEVQRAHLLAQAVAPRGSTGRTRRTLTTTGHHLNAPFPVREPVPPACGFVASSTSVVALHRSSCNGYATTAPWPGPSMADFAVNGRRPTAVCRICTPFLRRVCGLRGRERGERLRAFVGPNPARRGGRARRPSQTLRRPAASPGRWAAWARRSCRWYRRGRSGLPRFGGRRQRPS